MRTIDVNPEYGLALVEDIDPAGNVTNTRYVPLAEAPPMNEVELDQKPAYLWDTYMKQHHYVAGHRLVGLWAYDRLNEAGERPPKYGWKRWHP